MGFEYEKFDDLYLNRAGDTPKPILVKDKWVLETVNT